LLRVPFRPAIKDEGRREAAASDADEL